jgi:hypothetical protein
MPDLTSPAPWSISGGYIADATGTKAVARFVPDGRQVVVWAGSPADDVTISNGMLLAAAPLLRDALVRWVAYWDSQTRSEPGNDIQAASLAALRAATYLPFGPEAKP